MADRIRRASASAGALEPLTTFARNGAAWSEVAALESSEYRIRLGGLLRPNWMVGLCNGLAREKLSIDRAHTRRLGHDGTWIAELHARALPGARDPLQIAFIEFAETDDIPASGPLRLDDYQLIESGDHGGTLRLTFAAKDAVGLLGSLLAAFEELALLPLEMHIETREQQALDCLWLASAGPSKPSDSARRALDQLLHRSLRSGSL